MHEPASERAAQSTLMANWMRMLPVVSAARIALTKSVLKSVCSFVALLNKSEIGRQLTELA
jgi:hypothetical protein